MLSMAVIFKIQDMSSRIKTFQLENSMVPGALCLLRLFYSTSSVLKSPFHCGISVLTCSFSDSRWTTRMTFLTQEYLDFKPAAPRT